MSHTNQTANYHLPQFIGTDKPAWLVDFNQAMSDIDTQMKANETASGTAEADAQSALSGVTALNSQVGGIQTSVTALETQAPLDEAQIETNRQNIATNAQNIVDLDNRMGHTSITGIGDGSATGAIKAVDDKIGDLADLDTTDKSSIINAINEVVAGGGGDTSTVRYYNGYIQYSTDGGQTWINWINTVTPVDLIPLLTGNTSSDVGTASGSTNGQQTGDNAYKAFTSAGFKIQNANDYVQFVFANAHPATEIDVTITSDSNNSVVGDAKVQYTSDGTNWSTVGSNTITAENSSETLTIVITATVRGIRVLKSTGAGMFTITNFNVKG